MQRFHRPLVSTCVIGLLALSSIGAPGLILADDAAASTVADLRQHLAEVQNQFKAARAAATLSLVAADVAEIRIKKLQAELTKAQADAKTSAAEAVKQKPIADKANAEQQALVQQIAGNEAADQLRSDADAAVAKREAAASVLSAANARSAVLNAKHTKATSDAARAGRAMKDAQENLKSRQEAVEKAATDKLAAEKAAEGPKKLADASANGVEFARQQVTRTAEVVQAGKAALASAQNTLAAARRTADTANKSAATAKGTPREKSTADAAKAATQTMAKYERLAVTTAELLKLAEQQAKQATDGVKPAQEVAAKAAAQAKKLIEAATKAAADLKTAQDTLRKTGETIATSKATIESASQAAKAAEAEIAAFQPTLDKAQTSFDQLAAVALTKEKVAEAALIELGRLVSFSDSVAPIVAKRCLACHNARTAKGRLNMESFATLLKGGESGAAVEPGDGENSLLFAMVEDGSMPQDADPLTKEQIATIRRWIDTGARLNAGVGATARLIQIMPRLPQPPPPESYRVPLPVTALALSPDGKSVVSSGYHEVIVWNAENGEQVRRITNVAERVYDIEYSPDGNTLAVAAGTPAQIGEIKLFDATDGKLLGDLVRTDDTVFSVAFSPDGTRLASGGADRAIRVYNVATQKQQLLIEDHADWVMDVAWAPDGTKLASASRDKTSKIFDMNSGESLGTFNGHGEPVFGVGFSPDGKQIVTGGTDKHLRVWNVADTKEVRKIGGFGNGVFRIVVTKEGQVFSSSADKTARLHNIADGRELKKFSGHTDWVYTVAWSPAAKRIATGSYDGEIRVWNAEDASGLISFVAAPGYTLAKTAAAN